MIKHMRVLPPEDLGIVPNLNATFMKDRKSLRSAEAMLQFAAANGPPSNEIFEWSKGSLFTFPYKNETPHTFGKNTPQANFGQRFKDDYEIRLMRGSIQEESRPLSSLGTAKDCAQVFYDVIRFLNWHKTLHGALNNTRPNGKVLTGSGVCLLGHPVTGPACAQTLARVLSFDYDTLCYHFSYKEVVSVMHCYDD
ncbi:hypothetical protein J3R30DRAFT_3403148 [Lentinula aciculospora]|uniref:Fungal-type protein kinase domain-containing protein n=1 Tax=Lentinula aciculospora TaxID=153920 RepID=A0A9W9DR79_9AGAR|nr:hypothetical protein J3R30DRAFT_3403148 [Lentinula aciculospora]